MFPYSFNNIYGYLRYNNMYNTSPAIEEKLKNSECTVEELLDEDEIIQEMRNQNTKLINFFERTNVKKLVDFITVEPEEDEEKRGHRYPFYASEILNMDVSKIHDYFLKTDMELEAKERKASAVSASDSDMILNQDEPQDEDKQKKADDKQECEGKDGTSSEEGEMKPRESEDSAEKIVDKSVKIDTTGEENKNRIELLDYLLRFLESGKDLNYVLCGYFSKFFILLLTKNPNVILNYLYTQRQDAIEKLIEHSGKKSLAEVAAKVLMVESYMITYKEKPSTSDSRDRSFTNAYAASGSQAPNMETIEPIRLKFLAALFKRLNLKENDPEETSNISQALVEVIENKHCLEYIANDKEILEHLFSISKENSNAENNFAANYNYVEVVSVLCNVIKFCQIENLPLPHFESVAEGEDVVNSEKRLNNTVLGTAVINNLEQILANFAMEEKESDSATIEGTFGVPVRPLGIKRVKLVEFVIFLYNYFKHAPSLVDLPLIKANFLRNLLKFFFEYEWNNFYQNSVDSLLKYYFNNLNSHPEIVRHLFDELKLISQFMTYFKTNIHFSFNSNRKINHGFFAVLIDLCHKLSQVGESHPQFSENYFSEQWKTFVQERVNYWNKLFERKLCVPDSTFHTNVSEDFGRDSERDNPTEEIDVLKEEKALEETNPFGSKKEDNFFQMGSDEDWFKSGQNAPQEILENIDINSFDFDFVDENTHIRKKSQEEDVHLKVDELDEDNYNDANYWHGLAHNVVPVDQLNDAFRDLEL